MANAVVNASTHPSVVVLATLGIAVRPIATNACSA
jgi:hypothetical protein